MELLERVVLNIVRYHRGWTIEYVLGWNMYAIFDYWRDLVSDAPSGGKKPAAKKKGNWEERTSGGSIIKHRSFTLTDVLDGKESI